MNDVDNIFDSAVSIRILSATMVLTSLWMVETLWPFATNRQHRTIHGLRNLTMAAINAALVFSTLGLATATVAELAMEAGWGLLPIINRSPWTRGVLAFLVLDAWTYFWHRANHRFRFLWRFHRVHHSDTEMDVTSSARFHAGEIGMAAICRLPVVVGFGIAPVVLLIHETVLLAVSQFHHSNISLGRFDRLLRWVLVTPAMHRVHHSQRVAETNSNYASILSVWDRLFGSHVVIEDEQTIQLGLEEFVDPKWQTVTGMLKTPFEGS